MTKTTNYQLPKWEKTDRIQMSDFNDMTAALDAALKAVADGGTKLAVGTYVGTGQFGEAHPNTLAFDFAPTGILITAPKSSPNALILIAPAEIMYYPMDSRSVQVAWNGNTVSWYQINNGADFQMNQDGVSYRYIAIG